MYTFHVVWFYVHSQCCVVYSLVLCTLSAQMRRLCLSRNPSEIWTVVGLNIAKKAIRSGNRAAQKSKGHKGQIFKKGLIPLQLCKRWQFGWKTKQHKDRDCIAVDTRVQLKEPFKLCEAKEIRLLNLAGHCQTTHLTRCLLCLSSPHFHLRNFEILEKCLPLPAQSSREPQTFLLGRRWSSRCGANPTPYMAEKPPYRDQMEPVCTKTCILILSYPFLYIISHTSGGRFCSQKVFHKKLFEIFHKTMRWSEVVYLS